MYVKPLTDDEKALVEKRFKKIQALQNDGICFGCHNFESGDIFPDDGLIFYEDERIRCQFEKYPRVNGQTIIISREHYEDMSEMPLELGTYILDVMNKIIKLHKQILGAEKVYMCTICDGKRNHLHFQLFPRLEGDSIGYGNFVKDEGILMDYHDTVEQYRSGLYELMNP